MVRSAIRVVFPVPVAPIAIWCGRWQQAARALRLCVAGGVNCEGLNPCLLA